MEPLWDEIDRSLLVLEKKHYVRKSLLKAAEEHDHAGVLDRLR